MRVRVCDEREKRERDYNLTQLKNRGNNSRKQSSQPARRRKEGATKDHESDESEGKPRVPEREDRPTKTRVTRGRFLRRPDPAPEGNDVTGD